MELPASEIEFWKAYYSIYPLPAERDDMRAALLAAVIANVSGKTLKKSLPENAFLPDYLKDRKAPAAAKAKSIEQQNAEFAAFVAKYKAASAATGRKQP